MKLGPYTYDLQSRRLSTPEGGVDLSEAETALLDALCRADGRPVHRTALAAVMSVDEPRAVDFAVRRLRTKIEQDASAPGLILTVRGFGYRVVAPAPPVQSGRLPPRERLRLQACTVDLQTGRVSRPGRPEQVLTSVQLGVLQALLRRGGTAVDRDTLLTEVWGGGAPRQRRLVDAAVHRLRSVVEATPSEPRHVRSVRGVGYRLWLPPARTNLVAPSGPGVLRPSVTAQVAAALDDHRLVVLTGPPGVGKTWLAAQAGRELSDRLPGGAWWLDLSACHDVDDATDALCSLLQLDPSPRDRLRRACLSLGRRPAMALLLDGVEHVHGAETLLRALLASDVARVLVTSSRRLDGLDAHTHVVPRMSREQARKLMLQEGGDAVDPHVAAHTLDGIIDALDGNALAVRTAARLLRYHPATDVVPAALADADGTTGAIHRAVRACSPSVRRALDDLTVFRGPFTLTLASAVLGTRASVVRELVDRSLLERRADGERTEFTLYALVRPVLNPTPRASTTRAHASAFADRAEQLLARLRSPGRRAACDEVARRRADFIAAAQHLSGRMPSRAVAIVQLLQRSGAVRMTVVHDLRSDLLALPPFSGVERLLLDEALRHAGTPERAEALLDRAIAHGARPDDWATRRVRARILGYRRVRDIHLGDEPSDPVERIDWLIFRGRQKSWNDHPDTGMQDLELARRLARARGDRIGEIRAEHGIANAMFHADEPFDVVGGAFERVAHALADEGLDVDAATPAWRGAQALALAGELDRAVTLARYAEGIGDAMDDPALLRGAVLARARADLLREPEELLDDLTRLRAAEVDRGDPVAAQFAEVYRLVLRALRGDADLVEQLAATAPFAVADVAFTVDCLRHALGLSPLPALPRPRRSLRAIAAGATGVVEGQDPLVIALVQIARRSHDVSV